MINKEALEYLVGLKETEVLEIGGQRYTTAPVYRVKDPIPVEIKTTTLTALIEYIKSGLDKKFSNLLIHVVGPKEVKLYSELRNDEDRECYMVCEALIPSNIHFNKFIDTEQFNIMLQSSFVETEDKQALLKITGCIQDKDVREYGDDGVSQQVVVKTGVAKVGEALVPNPVTLAPYRTFPEIRQPESKFIFRMQSGPSAALFEADGGVWRNKAIGDIAEYLQNELKDFADIKIIY